MSKLTLKHDKKLGIIYHPDSSLVVKSAEEKRIVVGRVDNGEVKGIDDETIALCKKYEQYGFTIPQSNESESEDESEGEEDSATEEASSPPLPVKEYVKPVVVSATETASPVESSKTGIDDAVTTITAQMSSIRKAFTSLQQELSRKSEELTVKNAEIERLKASLSDKDQQLAKIKSIFA